MATLTDMQGRIAEELQIDVTTYLSDINRAINSAIKFYDDHAFWFLEVAPRDIVLTATSQYSLPLVLPDRSFIKEIVLQLTPGKYPLHYLTLSEYNEKDFDENFTGDPCYWTTDHDVLYIQPTPQRTFTATVWYTSNRSMSSSASNTTVWMNEAEELIRLHAEVDLQTNRMKDFKGAAVTQGRETQVYDNLVLKTIRRKGQRKVKPRL